MPAFIDRTGQRFGRLTALSVHSKASRIPPRQTKWVCLCDCGSTAIVDVSKLANGHTKSCGCLQIDLAHAANIKHGQSNYPNGGRATKEYNTWALMIRRCYKAGSHSYADYGGRGIVVCERWRDFAAFYADMGPAPSPRHSIDREDNDGPYSPDNCRWATPKEQRRNQTRIVLLEHAGQQRTPMEWAELTGIPNKRIHARMKRGWSIERTLTTPV